MRKTVNVLLVEDNEVDVEAVRRGFQRQRIANPIVVAQDGVVGLAMLRGGEVKRPYIILLDINMPRMNGIEFLRELRNDESLNDSVVFVLTTSDADEDKFAAYGLNVAGYILKSEVGEEFVNLTSMLDNYWRVVELPSSREL